MSIQKRIYAQMKWLQESSMEDSVESTPHSGIYQALCDRNLELASQTASAGYRGCLVLKGRLLVRG